MVAQFTETAEKQYGKLPKAERNKIDRKIALLQLKPLLGKKLEGVLVGKRSLKAWPYRIIYVINDTKRIILIISILHRQGAYK